jgi:UDP-galactopyranose mutase
MKIAIIGSGLYGATVAAQLKFRHGVTVFEKRDHIGGNVYTTYTPEHGHVSQYGAHIFHTNSDDVWAFINKFGTFNSYQHYVIGCLPNGETVDLPFNLSTFEKLRGIRTPAELEQYLTSLPKLAGDDLESHCISMIGTTVYELVVKNYTEKQWGKPCSKLPKSIIERLPIRLTRDRTYFHRAKYQGMPVDGYTSLVKRMLDQVQLVNFDVDLAAMEKIHAEYDRVFFSGQVDRLLNYRFGALPYRGLRFEHRVVPQSIVQGAPVINDLTRYGKTRTIEHSLFYPEIVRSVTQSSVITDEYPCEWRPGDEPYYPVRSAESSELHGRYIAAVQKKFPKMVVGGRLGSYRYYDMDQVIAMALKDARIYQ